MNNPIPKPGKVFFSFSFSPVEPFKNLRLVVFVNSNPIIPDANSYLALFWRIDLHFDLVGSW